MSFERGRSWQVNVFHLICILPPWLPICGFVVLPLRIKKAGSFFLLGRVFHWGRLLLRIMLLFLLGPRIFLAYLTSLFSPWKHLRRQYTGCFLPAAVCGDFSPHPLKITSPPLSRCPVQQGAAWLWRRTSGTAQCLCPLPGCQGLGRAETA